jgi:hypothetical protein
MRLPCVRDALLWDPVLRGFTLGDEHAVDRLVDRLDPISGMLGLAGSAAEGIIAVVASLLEGMLSPGFILIGGIGTIIIGLYLYYVVCTTWFGPFSSAGHSGT